MGMTDQVRCPWCGRTLPTSAFNRDRSRSTGREGYCRDCCKARRRGDPRPAQALVLVMPPRPAPPPPPPDDPDPELPPAAAVQYGHYAQAAERFITALSPPAGPADALLLVSLRDVAANGDRIHLGSLNPTADLNAVTGQLIRLQRELAATRAVVKAAPVAAPGKDRLDAFLEAL